MMRLRRSVALAVILGALTAPAQNVDSAPLVHVTLDSEPGDPLGQGLDYEFNSSDIKEMGAFARDFTSDGQPDRALFALGGFFNACGSPLQTDLCFMTLEFGTDQLGLNLEPGFYPNAQRAPFAEPGHPGLDVTLNGGGCNTVSGSFTIHDVVFSDRALTATGSPIETFSASFEQHCDDATPALFGALTYAAFAPEPDTVALLGFAFAGMGLARRRRLH